MESQYIIVLDGSPYKSMYEHMLMDILNNKNVTFVVDIPQKLGIKNILMKNKVRKYGKNIFDFLGYEENNLYLAIKNSYEKKKTVTVIFFNASFCYNPYVAETLKRYKKKWKSLRYVLFYLDIMDSPVSQFANKLSKDRVFDLIYTIEKNDAKKNDCILWKTFYSHCMKYDTVIPQNGIYFCGVSKNRSHLLAKIIDASIKSDINCRMDIVCYEDGESLNDKSGVKLHAPNDFLIYTDVIRNELGSSCILEIVQDGQTALTLRPYEAVVYNRKLLTNNRSILGFPYYNSKYMMFFEKVDDIDWNWVKEDCIVDYGYKGDFSPIYLLNDIERRLTENGERSCNSKITLIE